MAPSKEHASIVIKDEFVHSQLSSTVLKNHLGNFLVFSFLLVDFENVSAGQISRERRNRRLKYNQKQEAREREREHVSGSMESVLK